MVVERVGRLRVERRDEIPLEAVLRALDDPGTLIKRARKACTRRSGPWIVKEGRRTPVEAFKHAIRPGYYRRGWRVAQRLAERGVGAPAPVAYVEERRLGAVVWHATLMECLDGWVNVEVEARRIAAEGADPNRVAGFLSAIAAAVNALVAAGVRHTDLSGKNILTRSGGEFAFIDLDAAHLDGPYTDRLRLLNHVQLYDSFCDLWDDGVLGPFLGQMAPPGRDPASWLDAVRRGQARRRARTEAVWRRQGRLPTC